MYDYYLNKCQFKLFFNKNQYCPYATCKLSDNETMIYWSNFIEKVFSDFKDKGYNFNHIAQMNFITRANKWISHMISISNIICVL